MLLNSGVAAQLAAFPEGLYSMELVRMLNLASREIYVIFWTIHKTVT
jgi:hypothetical protein